MCKSSNSDTGFSVADRSNSDNYIGLVTLFVLLLQGSKWAIPVLIPEIPFDVVSLQQAHLGGELLLIIGIAENQNTYQQKTKRTKLGTNFFHAVSQFLNTNHLENLLSKIWNIMEVKLLKERIPMENALLKQLELKNIERCSIPERCTIPGAGKLSAYIKITPDAYALQKVLRISPSLTVYNDAQKAVSCQFNYDWFDPIKTEQEYTCITVENVVAITPKHISELLKRLRKESVEICGLKLGYVKTGLLGFLLLLSSCECSIWKSMNNWIYIYIP